MSPSPRVPAGTPDGGRFTPGQHSEATITLDALEAAAAPNTDGTSSDVCTTCHGDLVVGLDICPACDGLGVIPS